MLKLLDALDVAAAFYFFVVLLGINLSCLAVCKIREYIQGKKKGN